MPRCNACTLSFADLCANLAVSDGREKQHIALTGVKQIVMSTIPRWIKRTQTAGLIVTGAAIGYCYVSPALRVEEVSLPANTLLAKARMFGTDGKKQVLL